jgi:uncharacterized protein (DUF1697 family)
VTGERKRPGAAARTEGPGRSKYAALLRGINVGGNKKVPMADLRAMTAKLGFDDPKTLLQSGNLVFSAKSQPAAKLELLLEAATKKHIGVECSFLLRTADEWKRIMAANPFGAAAKSDPSHLAVTFCRDIPTAPALEALRAQARGAEDFAAVGRELFVWFPDGMGESKLALALSKNRLGTICTARNWNTVTKVGALLE